eukprot:2403706-Alexandrium_andersonii.AAC.1
MCIRDSARPFPAEARLQNSVWARISGPQRSPDLSAARDPHKLPTGRSDHARRAIWSGGS